MFIATQCVHCGETIVLVSPHVYAGLYPCPACEIGLLIIPVTEVTPINRDEFQIEPEFIVMKPINEEEPMEL